MSLFDVTIIYLALGAPVAMYRFFRAEGSVSASTLVACLATLLLWPAVALGLIVSRYRSSGTSIFVTRQRSDVHIIEMAETLRDRLIVSLLDPCEGPVKDPRIESLERYVDLSLALADAGYASPLVETRLFTASGHPDPHIAATCLARRNVSRLSRHVEEAAVDLARAVRRAEPKDHNVYHGLRELAETLGDEHLLQLLQARKARSVEAQSRPEPADAAVL